MNRFAKGLLCAGAAAAAWTQSTNALTGSPRGQHHAPSGIRFEITVPPSVHAEPITGRVYVMISRKSDPEPRIQVGRTGAPFFGRDVDKLPAGHAAVIDETDLGTPVESIRDLPAGDYFVQAFVNIYSEFKRADGHTVWMHDDQWEGQHWATAPGNLASVVQRVHVDPHAGNLVTLDAVTVLPAVAVPPDTEWVKRFKFQSPMLTKFWGRPVYLGATVLLPRDYARETIAYPVNYIQGHFSLQAPNGFDGMNEFSQAWMAMTGKAGATATAGTTADAAGTFPKMILVTFQHPNPYFDDSYAVNSPNVGPYGDAIMQELVPEVEKRFRVIKAPYARVLSGGSTGGWESLALQLFHPDFFGATWSYCPDSVTFTDVEGINVYEDGNAFYKQYEWRREPTVNSREIDGKIRQTSEQRNHFELVSGTHGRSGEQIDIWSAVFGPLGDDGYFKPLFDKRTGAIDRSVAQYWKDHYDLLEYMKREWHALGPKLTDKIHVYTGTMDTYQLNNSTTTLEKWMKATENPHYEGFFLYGDRKPHCWTGPVSPAERLKEMAQFIAWKSPEGATTSWWRY